MLGQQMLFLPSAKWGYSMSFLQGAAPSPVARGQVELPSLSLVGADAATGSPAARANNGTANMSEPRITDLIFGTNGSGVALRGAISLGLGTLLIGLPLAAVTGVPLLMMAGAFCGLFVYVCASMYFHD